MIPAGSSASSGVGGQQSRSGDISGATFTFEGINTGSRGVPSWVWPAVAAVVLAIVAVRVLRK